MVKRQIEIIRKKGIKSKSKTKDEEVYAKMKELVLEGIL